MPLSVILQSSITESESQERERLAIPTKKVVAKKFFLYTNVMMMMIMPSIFHRNNNNKQFPLSLLILLPFFPSPQHTSLSMVNKWSPLPMRSLIASECPWHLTKFDLFFWVLKNMANDSKCGCWAILRGCKTSDSRNSTTSIPRSSLVYDAGILIFI